MTSPAAARKNRYGNRVYPIPRPGSNQVVDLPSVSQVLKIFDAPGLNIWKLKTVAEQFSLRPDLVMLAANPDTRWDAINQAMDATKSKANTGTAIHYFTEAVDDGTLDWAMVTEAAKPWVEHYVEAKQKFGWEMVDKEFTVYNHELGYAGTSDRAMRFPGYGTCIADVKTGKDVHSDTALQLGCYAFGEGIWVPPTSTPQAEALDAELEQNIATGENVPPGRRKWSADAIAVRKAEIDDLRWEEYATLGQHKPMPDDLRQDVGFVIHLSDKHCDVVPMDLSALRPVVAGMTSMYHWKARRDIVKPKLEASAPAVAAPALNPVEQIQDAKAADPMEPIGDIPVAPMPAREERFASYRTRVAALSPEARQDLVFQWPTGVPKLKALDHTDAQLDAIDELLWRTENKYATPTQREEAERKVTAAFPGSSTTDAPF